MSNDKKLNWFEKQPQLTKKIIEERVKKSNWHPYVDGSPITPMDIKFAKDEFNTSEKPFKRSELIEYLKIMYNNAKGISFLNKCSLEQLESFVIDIYNIWKEEKEKEEKILKNPQESVSTALASSVFKSMKKQSEEIDMKLANSKLDKKNQKEEPEYLKGLTKEIILKRFGDKGMYTAGNLLIELYKNLTPNMLKTYRKNNDISTIMSYNLVSYIKTAIGRGHSILKGISKEKAWDVAIEIAEIVHKEKSDSDNTKEHKCSCGGNCNCHTKQKAKLTLADGREIEVEISEEELKKIEIKKSPYERTTLHEKYYYISDIGAVNSQRDLDLDGDVEHYLNINYYNDETAAKNDACADLLMRKLRKFAVENNEKNQNLAVGIGIRYYRGKIETEFNYGLGVNFSSHEIAEKAIETFKKELLWYFTEYLKIYE